MTNAQEQKFTKAEYAAALAIGFGLVTFGLIISIPLIVHGFRIITTFWGW